MENGRKEVIIVAQFSRRPIIFVFFPILLITLFGIYYGVEGIVSALKIHRVARIFWASGLVLSIIRIVVILMPPFLRSLRKSPAIFIDSGKVVFIEPRKFSAEATGFDIQMDRRGPIKRLIMSAEGQHRQIVPLYMLDRGGDKILQKIFDTLPR